MWNPKQNTTKQMNKKTKQNQIHKYREKASGCEWEWGGQAKQVKDFKSYKLPVINESEGWKVPGEYTQ